MLKVHSKTVGNVAILRLQGQVVNGDTEILRSAVQALSEVNAVRLDFAGVTTVDAAGLGAMLALREQAEIRGIRFELIKVTRQIEQVFKITRLDSVFRMTSSLEFFPTVSRGRQSSVAPLASCA